MSEVTIDPVRFAAINLQRGPHDTLDDGMCLLEATAFLAGERHSDHPACVSPVLGTFGRNLNDVLPDELRQRLKALIPSLPGTATDGGDAWRSYVALDWLIRTWLPAWLELSSGCGEDARRLRRLAKVVDLASARRADPLVREAQNNATAVAVSAEAGAWAAARGVVQEAAWDAARDAADAMAWDATGIIAGAAARAAHGIVAGVSSGIVRGAAGSEMLARTVRQLQLSAVELYAEMMIWSPAGPDGQIRAGSCGCSGHVSSGRRRGLRRRVDTRAKTNSPDAHKSTNPVPATLDTEL